MTLEGGNAIKGTGLAGEIAKARKKKYPDYDPSKDKTLDGEAKAIIDYLIENTVVQVDTGSGTGVIS